MRRASFSLRSRPRRETDSASTERWEPLPAPTQLNHTTVSTSRGTESADLSDYHTTWIFSGGSYRPVDPSMTPYHPNSTDENFINGNSLLNIVSYDNALLYTVEVSRIHLLRRDINRGDWVLSRAEMNLHERMCCGLELYFNGRDIKVRSLIHWEEKVAEANKRFQHYPSGPLRRPGELALPCLDCDRLLQASSIAC